MFKCAIVLPLTVRHPGEMENSDFVIAEYEFDPGLALGEIVLVAEAPFVRARRDGKRVKGNGPFFSFTALVVERLKVISPEAEGDEFTLIIKLEMADKEQLPDIVRLYKSFFPDAKDLREDVEDAEP